MRAAPWLGAVLVGCVGAGIDTDPSTVRDAVLARTGIDAAATHDELDPGIDPQAAALLQQPLTDEDGVRIALLNNRDVRAGMARLGIARADLVQAGLLRNPVFDASALWFAGGDTEIDLGLGASFVDMFHRPLRQRLAERDYAAVQTVVTSELVHLAFATRAAFVHVRASRQLVELQQRTLATAAAALELMRALHAAGNTTDQALAAWHLVETRARLDLAAAEQAADEAREPVQRLLGLWGPHTTWTIAGDLPTAPLTGIDLDHVESRSVARSLDLQAQRARVDALAQRAGLESWRAWLPDGHLGVAAMRDTDGEWGAGPQVMLELPLFDAGRARNDRAAAALRDGLHRHTQLAVEVRSAARMLSRRAAALATRLAFLQQTHLPRREDLVQRTAQHYNAMQIGAFDVLQARLLQLADEREALQVLRAATLARLELQELLAGNLPRAGLVPTWPVFNGAGNSAQNGGH